MESLRRASSTTFQSSPFHGAARDGKVDLLRCATRRDLNATDEDGMSPTHWAAYCGRQDALRLIVGRGGDPDRFDLWGNTSLHLAARNNHLNCVTFLVHFGANIWALDSDGHTALEAAGLNGHDDIVRFLDYEMSNQANLNPKEVQRKKLKAIQDSEKHAKKLDRLNKEMDDRTSWRDHVSAQMDTIKKGIKGPYGTLNKIEGKLKETLRIGKNNRQPTFSDLVAVGSRKAKRASVSKSRSLDVMLEKRDQPEQEEHKFTEPPSLFDRPGFGSVCFRSGNTRLYETFQNIPADPQSHSTGSHCSTDQIDSNEDISSEEVEISDLRDFLTSLDLGEFCGAFEREHINLPALMLLSEQDLVDLKIPMGPRKLIMKAIEQKSFDYQKSNSEFFVVHL